MTNKITLDRELVNYVVLAHPSALPEIVYQELRAALAEPPQGDAEPVHIVRSHGSDCWEEMSGESLEICRADPSEYEVRALYTHPAPAKVEPVPPAGGDVEVRAAFDAWFISDRSLHPQTDTTLIDGPFEPWRAWKACADQYSAHVTRLQAEVERQKDSLDDACQMIIQNGRRANALQSEQAKALERIKGMGGYEHPIIYALSRYNDSGGFSPSMVPRETLPEPETREGYVTEEDHRAHVTRLQAEVERHLSRRVELVSQMGVLYRQIEALRAQLAEKQTLADNYCALLMDANGKLAERDALLQKTRGAVSYLSLRGDDIGSDNAALLELLDLALSASAEASEPVAVVLPEFEPAFEAWWESDGQYCRAGGGDYEKTFAYRAYENALVEVARLNNIQQ